TACARLSLGLSVPRGYRAMPYLPKLHTPIYHNSFNIQGAGGEGPRPQTNTELLTGLRTCALSLTLSPGGRGNLWDSARSLSRLLFLWAFILHGLLLELRQGIPFQVNELVHQAGGYLEVGGQLRAFYHVVVPIFRFAKLVADCLAVALQVQGQHRLLQAVLGLRLSS